MGNGGAGTHARRRTGMRVLVGVAANRKTGQTSRLIGAAGRAGRALAILTKSIKALVQPTAGEIKMTIIRRTVADMAARRIGRRVLAGRPTLFALFKGIESASEVRIRRGWKPSRVFTVRADCFNVRVATRICGSRKSIARGAQTTGCVGAGGL